MRRICARCEIEYFGYGHNGLPLVNGRVCGRCNVVVVMDRFQRIMERKEVKE